MRKRERESSFWVFPWLDKFFDFLRGWADFHGELVILWVIRIKFSLPIARKLRFSTDGFILLSADWGGGEMMNSFFRTLEKFVKFVFDNGRLRRKRTGRRM